MDGNTCQFMVSEASQLCNVNVSHYMYGLAEHIYSWLLPTAPRSIVHI